MKTDCSVVLRVRGETLDPQAVSHQLGLESHRSASRNDPLQLSGDRSGVAPSGRVGDLPATAGDSIQLNLLRPLGSWQRFPPPELARASFERQLEYWLDLLKKRRASVKSLTDEGLEVVLSCVVQLEGAAAFRIAPALQRRIARLGIGLDFSILYLEPELEQSVGSTSDNAEAHSDGPASAGFHA